MKALATRLAGLVLGLLLAGCGGGQALVEPAAPVALSGTVKLRPQIAWSRSEDGPIETWTVDGENLNALVFVKGATNGDTLLPSEALGDRLGELPAYDREMTRLEVHDLYVATLSKLGYSRIATREVRPWSLGGRPGFRFEFSHQAEDGLRREGLAAGLVAAGRLWLITYTAPEVHYFQKYKPQVEALLSSITLL